jgi:hypothetical protein
MENNLYTLAYLSQANFDENDRNLSIAVSDILAASRRNNQRAGVTGALLLSNGWFAQILEGPADAVEEIFESVQCDTRHRNAKVLYYKPLEGRNFAQWSMGFSGVSVTDSQALTIDGTADPNDIGQSLLKILTDLIGRKSPLVSNA